MPSKKTKKYKGGYTIPLNSNSNSNSSASSVSSNQNNFYNNYYPEPSAENLANAEEFEENRRRYAQPIFAVLDEISSKEADFIASPTVNNLMDLFEAFEKYKREIDVTDHYSVRESFRIIEDVYNRLIDNIASSSNSNISNKSNEFSRIAAEIYDAVQRKLGLAGGVLFRKVLFRKKHGKKSRKVRKLTRKLKKLTKKH